MFDTQLTKQIERLSELSKQISDIPDSVAKKIAVESVSICVERFESLIKNFQKVEAVEYKKNMEDMDGYLNRHKDGLPKEKCLIVIYHKNINDPIEKRLCVWHPFRPEDYETYNMPARGFLGHATDVVLQIGFNVWEQNDSEFVYYKLVKTQTLSLTLSNIL